ncbi:hypothetical protein TMES_15565 [Thalassospira mesophila]|uniref:Uncharacterized protein n=1 Tax=Thalassospira mesophila TaxID=1293891 RepID=A0A1Y2KZS1_9PROT|nr:hypothetical protein TMES_15565 [Thalassospira mesophila]
MAATFAKSLGAGVIAVIGGRGFHDIAVFFTILRKNALATHRGRGKAGQTGHGNANMIIWIDIPAFAKAFCIK